MGFTQFDAASYFRVQTFICAQYVPSNYEASTVSEFWGGSNNGEEHDRDTEMGKCRECRQRKVVALRLPTTGPSMSAAIRALTNLWQCFCWRWKFIEMTPY
ncbi:hypothetical protein ACQJBY_041216 [Aegilops geniculata]